MGSFLKEGSSTNRPPLFDGTNYNYWSSRMISFVQSVDYTLWSIIVNGPLVPKITRIKKVTKGEGDNAITEDVAEEVEIDDVNNLDLELLRDSDKLKLSLNAKAITILHNSLSAEEYGRIQGCETAKQIWDCLEATHMGTSQVKDTKIRILTSEYESFKMKEGETISTMHQRFNLIVNNLKGLGKRYSRKDINGKILSCLTRDFRPKTCAITEAKDIGTLPEEELIGSLLAYEVELNCYKEQDMERSKEKRSLAMNVGKSSKIQMEEDDLDEELSQEEIAMFTKKFGKFMKQTMGDRRNYPRRTGFSKWDNNARGEEAPRCFECNKPGHIKQNCPLLKSRTTQRKVMQATWDNFNSEDEIDDGEDVGNIVCLMANGSNEVTSSKPLNEIKNSSNLEINNEELRDAFEELYHDHKTLIIKSCGLSNQNKILLSQLELLKKEIASLKIEQPSKTVNLETLELKQKFAKLKDENNDLKNDLKKFEIGENTLSKLLHTQHEYVGRRGIGYECGSTSQIIKPRISFVASTSKAQQFPSKNKEPNKFFKTRPCVFSCTYCQKGNHSSHICPIRKLCELGTLLPAWKKPKWVVKNNPSETNPKDPKTKTWVPRTRP